MLSVVATPLMEHTYTWNANTWKPGVKHHTGTLVLFILLYTGSQLGCFQLCAKGGAKLDCMDYWGGKYISMCKRQQTRAGGGGQGHAPPEKF